MREREDRQAIARDWSQLRRLLRFWEAQGRPQMEFRLVR